MTQKTTLFRAVALCVAGALMLACDAQTPKQAASKTESASKQIPKPKPNPGASKSKSSALLPPSRGVTKAPTELAATAPSSPRSILDGAKSKDAPKPKEPKEDAPGVDRPIEPAEVMLQRFVLTTDVQAREPVDERDVFTTETPKIFAFMHFENPDAEPYAVKVHFEKADEPATPYGVELRVKTALRWRTWAYTRIRREPGKYRAVIRTLDGKDIATLPFEIVPAK